MIKRCARAAYCAFHHVNFDAWDAVPAQEKAHWFDAQLASIREMREPAEAMLDEPGVLYEGSEAGYLLLSKESATEFWHDMISKALHPATSPAQGKE